MPSEPLDLVLTMDESGGFLYLRDRKSGGHIAAVGIAAEQAAGEWDGMAQVTVTVLVPVVPPQGKES